LNWIGFNPIFDYVSRFYNNFHLEIKNFPKSALDLTPFSIQFSFKIYEM